jgi:hypothetical protein
VFSVPGRERGERSDLKWEEGGQVPDVTVRTLSIDRSGELQTLEVIRSFEGRSAHDRTQNPHLPRAVCVWGGRPP